MKGEIKLIICDFDGTLVDTRQANYFAYRDAMQESGYTLKAEQYNECFGLRFVELMAKLGIKDEQVMKKIKDRKAALYPSHFDKIKINKKLVGFIEAFKKSGGKTALASTASLKNIQNVLEFTRLNHLFDTIISGDDITKPKSDPECYIKAMQLLNVQPDECLIFEDAPIGIAAAAASGASYIVVKEDFHEN